ncbi:MAG: alpha/beta hydrolase family esterase [Gammaproteobacteria bacterium]
MTRLVRWVAVAFMCALHVVSVRAACGGEEAPCAVPLGDYHFAAPADAGQRGPMPVVVHFHGAGGSGAALLRNGGLTNAAMKRGYVVVAPNGLKRPGRFGTGWSFRPEGLQMRDELAFVKQVLDDLGARADINRNRVLLSGFSIGGSLVWYLACKAPTQFAAYAPVAGGFWRPHPQTCAGPVRLLHTHGWRDKTVPLEGRPLRDGAIHQGDIFEGLQVWRRVNGCQGLRADEFDTEGRFWRRVWTRCDPGTALEFALHPGSHGVPKGWSSMALDWFEGKGAGDTRK